MSRAYSYSEQQERAEEMQRRRDALDKAFKEGGLEAYQRLEREFRAGDNGARIDFVGKMGAGAAIGSLLLPGVGTIIGAAIGGAIAKAKSDKIDDKTGVDNLKRAGRHVGSHLLGGIIKKDLG